MPELIKFSLKDDFREPFRLDLSKREYVGRKPEFNRLIGLVRSRSAANVVVSGLRGVGKSSYVNEGLRKLNQSKGNLVIVDLSLAQLPAAVEPDTVGAQVLRTLIRGLYFALKEKGNVSEELEDIYQKTYFTELKNDHIVELATKNSNEETKSVSEVHTRTYSLSINTAFLKAIVALVYAFAGIRIADIINVTDYKYWILFAMGLIIAMLLPWKMNWSRKNAKSNSSKEIRVIDEKSQKSGIGNLDLSPQTLEIVLRQELKRQEKKDHKVVFVLDELDKLNKPTEKIYEIIESLKNLFTLSCAIFIFITDDAFYDDFEKKKIDKPYSKQYTLFTDIIFLSSMDYEDIDLLIDKFEEGRILKGSADNFKKFKLYIGWKSANHVFDVYSQIDQFIVYDNKGKGMVSVKSNEELERGNLEDGWQTLAALQLIVTTTLNDHYYSNNSRLKQKLFLTLREVAKTLLDNGKVVVPGDDYLAIVDPGKLKLDVLTTREKEDFSGAVQDMLYRMHRLEGFVDEAASADGNVTYTLSTDPVYPSQELMENIREALDFEQTFITKFNNLKKLEIYVKGGGLRIFDKYQKEIESWEKAVSSIEKKEGRRVRKSVIQASSDKIDEIVAQMPSQILEDITELAVEKNTNIARTTLADGLDGRHLRESDPLMAEFYNRVEQLPKDTYVILRNSDKNNTCIVVGYNLSTEIQEAFLAVNRQERTNTFPVVFNIITDKEIGNKTHQAYWQIHNLDAVDYKNIASVTGSLDRAIQTYLL